MNSFSKSSISSLVLVIALILVLAILAALQYRWIGEVNEAVHERMHTSLLASMNQFRRQFNDEFQHIGFLLQPDMSELAHRGWKSYAESCSAALNVSDTHLVRDVYLWVSGNNGASQLLRLNRNAKAFEIASWPPELDPIKSRYAQSFSNPQRLTRDIRPFAWTMFCRIPLLLQPLVAFQPGPNKPGSNGQFIGCLLMELNLETIRTELFPELARRCFEGPNGFIYQVAVVSGPDPAAAIYRSDSSLDLAAFAQTDARISLIDNPGERLGPLEPGIEPLNAASPGSLTPPFGPEPPPRPGARNDPLILSDDDSFHWELAAKHRAGSLEAAVAGLRQKNLAIGFGSLLLLAVSMGLIIISARRAQRLAQLQIDFVAGISHELRTPLAVICSAGDNLAEGVVADSGKSAMKYGELIRSEGRKLAGMIEQILQFASVQRGPHYSLRPAHINEVADAALNQAQPMISAAGFSAEKSFASDLPLVNVNVPALSQAILNLIQNAVKYSGENRWLAIRTEKADLKRGTEVQIIVEDKGMGIEKEDLPHIFEPFYRGGTAKAAQIHGTGLGLFMARKAVHSKGGRITTESAPGKGSRFTISLPALPIPLDNSSSNSSEGKPEHAVQDTVDRR